MKTYGELLCVNHTRHETSPASLVVSVNLEQKKKLRYP